MGLFRNKETSMALKEFAKIHGISVKEVKEGIQLQIDDIFSSDDSEKQASLKKIFGNRILTPEEYITKLSEYGLKHF